MIRGAWSRDMIAWIIVIALLPTLAVLLVQQGVPAAQRVAMVIAVLGAWQLVFRFAAGVPMSPTAFVQALALAVLAPGDLAAWQLVLVASFGAVLGELIFGGWGRNFLSASVVSLAFVFVAFPEVRQEPAGAWHVPTSAAAAAMLLATGILAWRVLAAALAALLATTMALGAEPVAITALGGVAFGLVFLACDPVSSPTTPSGRVVYGLLVGALTVMLGQKLGSIGAPQAIVFATLLAAIFAPLIDRAVIAIWAYRRKSRHG